MSLQIQDDPVPVSIAERAEIEQFLYEEAALLDDHRYSEWLSLLTDDVIYWVPGASEATSPDDALNVIYDNRARLEFRARRLAGKWVLAQDPPSRMVRVVTNIRIVSSGAREFSVRSSLTVTEQRREEVVTWVGRCTHELVHNHAGEFRIRAKTVDLVNRFLELSVISFIP